MEDLTGLGKIVNSELVKQVYEDGVSDATVEAGKAFTDIVKSFRLFMAPFQFLAAAQDRLAAYCERVRSEVPKDRQIEAAPSVASPVLMELRFMEEENPITELYLNLLKCAIDRDRVNEAHPAFVKIIGQLSPDEAMILHNLKSIKIEVIEYRKINHSDYHVYSVAESNYPDPDLANSTQLSMCLQHLEYLNLIYYNVREGGRFGDHQFVGDLAPFRATAELTQFGQLFVSACAP